MSSAVIAVPQGRARTNLAVVLFLCGLVPGFYEFLHPDGFGFGRGDEMAAIARSLAATGAFANPFEPHVTGPTASNPPLYPLFLGALLRCFGPAGTVLLAVFVNILLNAAVAALLPRLAEIFYGDRFPGFFAGLLWICSARLLPQWDTTTTAAGLILFCLLAVHDLDRGSLRPGLLAGALTLLNPAVALIFGPWLLYLLVRRRHPHRLRYFAVFIAIVGACNLPWIARNYRVFHAPVLRTNFGYTIYTSNNDCAQPSLYANTRNGCYQQTHPSASATENQLLATLGEVRYDRLRSADTLRWIGLHPRRFAILTATRIVEFWFPDPNISPRSAYAMWLATALSLPGLWLMIRRRNPALLYILTASLLYPLMFYIVVSSDRYRVPLLWTSLLPAGYFLAHIYGILRRRSA